jgi:hypothetical protein
VREPGWCNLNVAKILEHDIGAMQWGCAQSLEWESGPALSPVTLFQRQALVLYHLCTPVCLTTTHQNMLLLSPLWLMFFGRRDLIDLVFNLIAHGTNQSMQALVSRRCTTASCMCPHFSHLI